MPERLIAATDDDNCNALVALADGALYRAKAEGRDRVLSLAEAEMSFVAT